MIKLNSNTNDMMSEKVQTLANTYIPEFLQDSETGRWIIALSIVTIGWFLSIWVKRLLRKFLTKIGDEGVDRTLRPLLVKIARIFIFAMAILVALSYLGVPMTSVIAILTAAGLAIALALQNTLSNIASGIVLLVLRPLAVGETVITAAATGTVEEVGLFNTTIRTSEGIYLYVPNSKLTADTIKNMNRNPERRIDMPLALAYGEDVEKTRTMLLEVMNTHANTIKGDKAPSVSIDDLINGSISLTARCWTKSGEWSNTRSDLLLAFKQRLDAADVQLAALTITAAQ